MVPPTTNPKVSWPAAVAPNMPDYGKERAGFRWADARSALEGLPDGRGLNIAHEAVDRHASGQARSRVALSCIDRRGARRTLTYGDLADESSRFANVLAQLGVAAGERIFVLMPRTAELYAGVLGALKHRCVVAPLFPVFGPEPVRQRLVLGGGTVLLTTATLFRHKVAPVRDRLPALRHVLLADVAHPDEAPDGALALPPLLAAAASQYVIPRTSPDDMALLHFTSGTTGTPKGAVHVHDAVVVHEATGRLVLDLHPDDVYWCTADPGWVTGSSYGIVAPLAAGVTSVVDEGDFDAERWYEVLESQRVTVWYTSPTALRMLRRAGPELARGRDLRRLRFVASVGEPLNPELVTWGQEVLGVPVHDNWWQTETGGIMIANYAAMDIRPGSMGRPVPGIEATVLSRDPQGAVRVGPDGAPLEAGQGEVGELALHAPWPSMFRGYLGDEERYRAAFLRGWYLSGDLVRRDDDGYFWFVGRADDVIKSAGHLIGPFEVESALLEHPAVAEAGVVGLPDPIVGDVVHAYVALRPGVAPSDELRLELLGHARRRLGAAVAPREIEFDQDLPHTRSGKVLRRVLRDRALQGWGAATSDREGAS